MSQIKLLVGLLFLLPCFPKHIHASTACTGASWFNTHTAGNAANGDDGYCFATPQAMNITLYEFGLCTSSASPDNRDQCVNLFSNPVGMELELSAGVSLPLVTTISIPEGVYSHAFIVLSNITSLKTVTEFSNARTDDRGSLGTYCYTDGRSINNSDSIISCGNDPKAARASTEVIGLSEVGYANTLLDYTVTMQGQRVVTDLFAITSDGILSTKADDDFALFGSQILNQSISITPNTSNIDIAFSITDGVTIGFANGGPPFNVPARNTDAPVDAAFEGLKFIIQAE